MREARIAFLLKLALNGTIDRDERTELVLLLAEQTDDAEVNTWLTKAWQSVNPLEGGLSDQEQQRILHSILAETPAPWYRQRRFLRILTVAASLLVVSLGAFLMYDDTQRHDDMTQEVTLAEAVQRSNIKPGSDRAFITLSSGQTILLDDATEGVIAEDAGARIRHLDNGEIQYEELAADAAPTLNTITIPKGGQYRVVLPDGTKVHLNAETSLTYPTRFTQQQRMVEIKGEALFEVKSNNAVPFVVKTATQEITVLGTVFNIEAYDHQVKTSLAEGAVKVSAGTKTVQLSPGQQAVSQSNGAMLKVETVDLDEVLAWHKDLFLFEDEEITSIMARVARWYNVDIEYRGNLAGKRFGGVFQRSKDVVQLLESMKMTGLVDFKITERRIIVMEK